MAVSLQDFSWFTFTFDRLWQLINRLLISHKLKVIFVMPVRQNLKKQDSIFSWKSFLKSKLVNSLIPVGGFLAVLFHSAKIVFFTLTEQSFYGSKAVAWNEIVQSFSQFFVTIQTSTIENGPCHWYNDQNGWINCRFWITEAWSTEI